MLLEAIILGCLTFKLRSVTNGKGSVFVGCVGGCAAHTPNKNFIQPAKNGKATIKSEITLESLHGFK